MHSLSLGRASAGRLNDPVTKMFGARISILRHRAIHVAEGTCVREHATQAYKLVIALDAPLRVRHVHGDFECRGCLVPPFAEQAMASPGRIVALFVDPGEHGAPYSTGGCRPHVFSGRTLISMQGIARDVADARGQDDVIAASELGRLVFGESRQRIDPRVEEALRRVASDPDAGIEQVATSMRMSSTRLRHLVYEATRLTLRTHRLWHRTLLGVEALATGAPIVSAALAADFADHAHFTRSFVRFFGRTPSSLGSPMRIVQTYADRSEFTNRSAF